VEARPASTALEAVKEATMAEASTAEASTAVMLTLKADRGSLGEQKSIAEDLLPIITSGIFNDVTVVCADGKLTAARAVLAISFPSFHSLLAGASDDPVTMLMPESSVSVVKRAVWARITHGLEPGVLEPGLAVLDHAVIDPAAEVEDDEQPEEELEEDDDYIPQQDEMSDMSDTVIKRV
jgi:hypothetical protein